MALSSERPQAATPEPSEGTEISRSVKAIPPRYRTPIEALVRQQIADRLQQDPLVNYTELALEVGVSDDVVGRIAKKLHGVDDLATRRLKSFQTQLGKALPVKERVRKYAEVVRGEVDAKGAFSVLSALKRVEELEGIVTAKERRETADNQAPKLPAMFVLPENAQIDVGIRVRTGKK